MTTARVTTPSSGRGVLSPDALRPSGPTSSRMLGIVTFALSLCLLFVPGAWIAPSVAVALLGSAAAGARPGDAAAAAAASCLLLHAGFVAFLGRGVSGPFEAAACVACGAMAFAPLLTLRMRRRGNRGAVRGGLRRSSC